MRIAITYNVKITKYYKAHCVGDFGSCKKRNDLYRSIRGCKVQITVPNEESRSMLRIAFEIRDRWPSSNLHNWRVIDCKFNGSSGDKYNRNLEFWKTKLWIRTVAQQKSCKWYNYQETTETCISRITIMYKFLIICIKNNVFMY